jgi:hypothetical protein
MSESEPKPSLHIDTDWKKQAQEEKRRLAEAEKAKVAQSTATPSSPGAGAGTIDSGASRAAATGVASAPSGATTRGAAGTGAREARELPPPSFSTLVQSIVTQALFYLGDLAPRGSEPVLNLDMAKHQIDLLGVVEEKTKNNLADDEKRLLDAALYETRMRYISVASQFLGP